MLRLRNRRGISEKPWRIRSPDRNSQEPYLGGLPGARELRHGRVVCPSSAPASLRKHQIPSKPIISWSLKGPKPTSHRPHEAGQLACLPHLLPSKQLVGQSMKPVSQPNYLAKPATHLKCKRTTDADPAIGEKFHQLSHVWLQLIPSPIAPYQSTPHLKCSNAHARRRCPLKNCQSYLPSPRHTDKACP